MAYCPECAKLEQQLEAVKKDRDAARALIERLVDAMHVVEHKSFCDAYAGKVFPPHWPLNTDEYQLGCDVAAYLKGKDDAKTTDES